MAEREIPTEEEIDEIKDGADENPEEAVKSLIEKNKKFSSQDDVERKQ